MSPESKPGGRLVSNLKLGGAILRESLRHPRTPYEINRKTREVIRYTRPTKRA